MKPQQTEMLLKDLLRITTIKSDRLSEVLGDDFGFLNRQIVKILREQYQEPRNDWKVICGCFSVIGEASKRYPRIGSKIFRASYPLINKGLLDRRVSVKRFAVLSVLSMIGKIHNERQLLRLGDKDDGNEIDAEIRELKKSIRSGVFLESFDLVYPNRLDGRMLCEGAGIKEESLVEVSKSMLG